MVGYATAPQHPNNSQALLQTQIWEETWQKACSVYLRRKFPLTRLQFTLQSSLSCTLHRVCMKFQMKLNLNPCSKTAPMRLLQAVLKLLVGIQSMSLGHGQSEITSPYNAQRCGHEILSTTCPTLLIYPLFHCTLSASSQCQGVIWDRRDLGVMGNRLYFLPLITLTRSLRYT